MTNVDIIRDKEGFIREFTVDDHADFAEAGSDIVCAAISAIVQTALGALDELAGIRNFSIEDGYVRCAVPSDIPEEKKQIVKIILETMTIGLKQIELTPEYSEYISILDEEV